MGRGTGRAVGFCRDVVNRFLLHGHALEIGRQRFGLLLIFGSGRIEAHQVGEHDAVIVILDDALFEHLAELLPEGGISLGLFLGQPAEFRKNLFHRRRPDPVDVLVVLKKFTGYIQRQVRRINNATDEPQVRRHQVFRIIHDKDAPHVQINAMALLTVPEVKWCFLRNKEERCVLQIPFDTVVQGRQWCFAVITQ